MIVDSSAIIAILAVTKSDAGELADAIDTARVDDFSSQVMWRRQSSSTAPRDPVLSRRLDRLLARERIEHRASDRRSRRELHAKHIETLARAGIERA